VLLFGFITFKWIIPQLYFEENQPVIKEKINNTKSTQTNLSNNSKWRVFLKYQIRQLSDTTLILQMLFSKFYLPIIMVAPILLGENALDLSVLHQIPHLWGAYLILGAVIGLLLVTETSVSGVIISFDKENYHYFKALPLSFRGYLKNKFYFSFLIEWLLGAIVILGLTIYLGMGLFPIGMLLVGYTITTYMTSLYYYMRDYRLLDLNWANFSDLMQRGMSQAARIFIQIIVIFIGVFAIMAFLFWFTLILSETIRLLISIGMVLLLGILLYSFYQYSEKKFWSKFNQ
jgi:ABC-2 type transport system permease protein